MILLKKNWRHNPHYEKLADVPFEIPDSWEWVKLGEVCKVPASLEKALYLDELTLNKYPKEEFL